MKTSDWLAAFPDGGLSRHRLNRGKRGAFNKTKAFLGVDRKPGSLKMVIIGTENAINCLKNYAKSEINSQKLLTKSAIN